MTRRHPATTRRAWRSRRGFTIAEALIVAVLVGLLATVTLMAQASTSRLLLNQQQSDAAARYAQSILARARQLGCASGVVDSTATERSVACGQMLSAAPTSASGEIGDLAWGATSYDGVAFTAVALRGSWDPGSTGCTASPAPSTQPALLQRTVTVSWTDLSGTSQSTSLTDQTTPTPGSAAVGGPNTRALLLTSTAGASATATTTAVSGLGTATVTVSRTVPTSGCLWLPYLRPDSWLRAVTVPTITGTSSFTLGSLVTTGTRA